MRPSLLLLSALLLPLITQPALGEESLEEVLRSLREGDTKARVVAARKLSDHEGLHEHLELLMSALGDEEPWVRAGVIAALGELTPERGRPAVPALLRHLQNDPSERVQVGAAFSLRKLEAREAIVPIAKRCALGRGDEEAFGHALSEFAGPLPPEVVQHLPRVSRRFHTTTLLGVLGKVRPLSAALPALLEYVRVRPWYGAVTDWVPPSELVPAICEAYPHESKWERKRHLLGLLEACLGKLGAGGTEAIPTVKASLQESRPELCLLGLQCVQRLGPAASPLVAEIETLLERDPGHRVGASQALAAIGADASSAAPTLFALCGDEDYGPAAEQALSAIGESARKQDRLLWWVPFRGYALRFFVLFALTGAWLVLSRRIRWGRVGALFADLLGPTAVTSIVLYVSLDHEWLEPFLPEPPLVILDPALSSTLSATFLASLVYGTLWLRRPAPEPTEPEGPGPQPASATV